MRCGREGPGKNSTKSKLLLSALLSTTRSYPGDPLLTDAYLLTCFFCRFGLYLSGAERARGRRGHLYRGRLAAGGGAPGGSSLSLLHGQASPVVRVLRLGGVQAGLLRGSHLVVRTEQEQAGVARGHGGRTTGLCMLMTRHLSHSLAHRLLFLLLLLSPQRGRSPPGAVDVGGQTAWLGDPPHESQGWYRCVKAVRQKRELPAVADKHGCVLLLLPVGGRRAWVAGLGDERRRPESRNDPDLLRWRRLLASSLLPPPPQRVRL